MNKRIRIFVSKYYFLFAFSLLFADSFGAASETRTISDKSFNGTLTVLSDGRLELSMKDGSRIFLGPGNLVDPRTIGKTDNLSLRSDPQGRIIFVADRQLVLIYTFQYKPDNSWLIMTDPKD